MKIVNCKLKISNKAFTLIELMVAIAIIGILAGVVLVSMSSYAKRARQTAALQTASSVMPAAMKCALEGKPFTHFPKESSSGGGAICDGSSFQWPTLDTSSTKGWLWGEQESSTPDNYGYWSCSAYTGGCTTGDVQVLCAVTRSDWSVYAPDSKPGNCVVRTIL